MVKKVGPKANIQQPAQAKAPVGKALAATIEKVKDVKPMEKAEQAKGKFSLPAVETPAPKSATAKKANKAFQRTKSSLKRR